MSVKIAAMNEPQENELSSHMIFIDQSSFSFKKYIQLIEKDDGKTKLRSIYEVIRDNFLHSSD